MTSQQHADRLLAEHWAERDQKEREAKQRAPRRVVQVGDHSPEPVRENAREAAVNAWNTRAASQPDREAVKEFIASASFASRSSLDSDTIFCEIYTPGYQPAKKGSFGFFVKELRAILSLLSGASTKSDGIEVYVKPMELADNRTDYFVAIKVGDREVTPHVFRDEYKAAYHVALYNWLLKGSGEEPELMDFNENDWPAQITRPSPGPDVREALGESSQTLEYLRREARTWGKIFSVNVDHVLDKNRKALSALTRPLGGFVQGSIARKQSTDTEGSSRTETAGGAG